MTKTILGVLAVALAVAWLDAERRAAAAEAWAKSVEAEAEMRLEEVASTLEARR